MPIFNSVYKSTPYPTESIVYKMNADSNGKLYVPIAGGNHNGSFGASYNRKVSIDGGEKITYSGTGNFGKSIEFTGYTAGSNHIIMIEPVSKTYGWALAYCWMSTKGSNYITEVLYDNSYMGYGISETNTGNYFRYQQYGRTSITKAPDEYLPDTVTTIGTYFRDSQYTQCTSLISASEESMPNSITSIGNYFRHTQYSGCSALSLIEGWKDLSIGGNNYRNSQFDNCNTNKIVKVLSNVGYGAYSNTLSNTYVTEVKVPSAYLQNFIGANVQPRSSITDSKFIGY